MTRFRRARDRCMAAMARLRRSGRIGGRGAAAIEFALFSPVLILMILGVYEYSRWAGVEIELEQALRAGAQSAMMVTDFQADYCAQIDAAVVAATDLTPSPTRISCTDPPDCRCPDGTLNLDGCPGDSNYDTCPGGITPDVYISFEFETVYDPVFFSLPGIIDDPKQELTIRIR